MKYRKKLVLVKNCPRCKELLVFPRGDTPYCEECGYPEEDYGKENVNGKIS